MKSKSKKLSKKSAIEKELTILNWYFYLLSITPYPKASRYEHTTLAEKINKLLLDDLPDFNKIKKVNIFNLTATISKIIELKKIIKKYNSRAEEFIPLSNWKKIYFDNIEKFSSIIFNELNVLNFLAISTKDIEILNVPKINENKISLFYISCKLDMSTLGNIWLNIDDMKWNVKWCSEKIEKKLKKEIDELIKLLNFFPITNKKEIIIFPKPYKKHMENKIQIVTLFDQDFFILKDIKDIKDIPDFIFEEEGKYSSIKDWIDWYYDQFFSLKVKFEKNEKQQLINQKNKMYSNYKI